MDTEEQLYRSEHWLDKEKEKKQEEEDKEDEMTNTTEEEKEEVYNLFAFPGECNFSGVKHTLEWVNRYQSNGPKRASKGYIIYIHLSFSSVPHILPLYLIICVVSNTVLINRKWAVMVDAAALASNTEIDLSRHPADFVCVSFYKIFGYPTGIGALIVRNGMYDVVPTNVYLTFTS